MRLALLFLAACAAAPPPTVAAPRIDSRAAATRAIDHYIAATDALYVGLRDVIDRGEHATAFDHETGRVVWRQFADRLVEIDNDLAIVASDPQFSLEYCLACLKHDWNHDGKLDSRDEKVFAIELYDMGDPRRTPTFRFDVGDAEWARAMISFQRAAVELILAYRWSDLDGMLYGHERDLHIRLYDKERVRHARALILNGLVHAEQCRAMYLAETDDDREWVPNPRQHSPVPLPVDDALYDTWKGVLGDVRRMLASEEGISLREVGTLISPELGALMPDAYVDLGAMLREPTDFTIAKVDPTPASIEAALRGVLGHGYREHMKPSPLVGRLMRMRRELEAGGDTFEHKLRYFLWLN